MPYPRALNPRLYSPFADAIVPLLLNIIVSNKSRVDRLHVVMHAYKSCALLVLGVCCSHYGLSTCEVVWSYVLRINLILLINL